MVCLAARLLVGLAAHKAEPLPRYPPCCQLPTHNQLTVIARIIRPQGRRGELLAEILTDFPEKFAERKQVWLSREDISEQREYTVEDHWFHKGRVVLHFSGVDSISQAESLTG